MCCIICDDAPHHLHPPFQIPRSAQGQQSHGADSLMGCPWCPVPSSPYRYATGCRAGPPVAKMPYVWSPILLIPLALRPQDTLLSSGLPLASAYGWVAQGCPCHSKDSQGGILVPLRSCRPGLLPLLPLPSYVME